MTMKYDLTPYQITSRMVNTLAAIAESTGQLEGRNLIQPGPQLRRKNRIQTIQASLAIEGNSLTCDQVTALLDKKRVFGSPRDILEVQNAMAAYCRIAEFTPLSMDSLLEAHGIMMKGLKADAVSLRQGQIGVIRENNIF